MQGKPFSEIIVKPATESPEDDVPTDMSWSFATTEKEIISATEEVIRFLIIHVFLLERL